MDNCVDIRVLSLDDLHEGVLASFVRFQETTRVRYVKQGQLYNKEDYFVEEWTEGQKKRVIGDLRKCIASSGVVVGAFTEGKLVGFANIEGQFIGSRKQYLELPYIHVSFEHRGQGIGKQLFKLLCQEAEKKGAQKLYIGAHPAIETQQFYQSVGCVLSSETIQDILDKQPLDIQLEYIL